jgi:hypothetical protein
MRLAQKDITLSADRPYASCLLNRDAEASLHDVTFPRGTLRAE